jgi:glycosyltransferase involved in cell wall biosynthesis
LRVRSRLQPKALAQADLVLGLSERFNELIHLDYGVPEDRLAVIRTPVDLERFTPDGPAETFEKRALLFVSRISTRKGLEEIIELSYRLADLADSVRLMVIGGPTAWSDYTGHLERLNPEVAEYLGAIASDRLPAMMRGATMLLVPSRYEPGSITAVEALACGLPVVLSDEVGAAEAVEGPHARRHAPADVAGLEAAVRSLLEGMESSEAELRAGARRNAEERFAPEIVVAALVDRLASAGADVTALRGSPSKMQDRVAELR